MQLNLVLSFRLAVPSKHRAVSLSYEVFAADVMTGFDSMSRRTASCRCSPSRLEGGNRITCLDKAYEVGRCQAPSPALVPVSFSRRKCYRL